MKLYWDVSWAFLSCKLFLHSPLHFLHGLISSKTCSQAQVEVKRRNITFQSSLLNRFWPRLIKIFPLPCWGVVHAVLRSEEVLHFPFSFACGLECICCEFWASSVGNGESSGATCCSGLPCYTCRHLLLAVVVEKKSTRGAGSLPLLVWLLLCFCDGRPNHTKCRQSPQQCFHS